MDDDVNAAPRTSTGKISDPELRLQAIERMLLLAQRYITVVEVRPSLCTHLTRVSKLSLEIHVAILIRMGSERS